MFLIGRVSILIPNYKFTKRLILKQIPFDVTPHRHKPGFYEVLSMMNG